MSPEDDRELAASAGAGRPGALREDGPMIAIFGGVYSNHLALEAAIADARRRGAEELHCLGDLGAFGPHPDRVFPLLVDAGVDVVRGNYDDSLAQGLGDCQCGYTDPRDNHFARLSYQYTFENTSERWKRWMGDLPEMRRLELGGADVLMCHGSPRRTNEFLWQSTTSTDFLRHLFDAWEADVILATHTGIHWKRRLPDGRLFANVGSLGRPANDGRTEVWYALLGPVGHGAGASDAASGSDATGPGPIESGRAAHDGAAPAGTMSAAAALDVELVPLAYDHERLAAEMRSEGLPAEFVETIRTGWWTTCLEILPVKERRRGRY